MSLFDIFKIFDIFHPLEAERLHTEMSFVYSPHYNLPLEKSVEPASKFMKLYELVLYDMDFRNYHIYEPQRANRNDLELIHSTEYLDDLFSLKRTDKNKYSELPLNHKILESFLYSVGGTIFATKQTEKDQFVEF